ncbi:MAG: type II toxin-antitoxin system Phd/YefM family antitoxin [Candidatus Omnitrophica bacterium]|nr:type II toxin-antitoxin system Phd/YefM family antitoxin [Candidatus Omnitrophota bacterium]
MKDMPMTEARAVLTSLPDTLSHSHETVAVTRRGKPVLAILPWEEYEALVETLEVMADEQLMASVRQGIRDIKQGKLIPWDAVKRKLTL